MATVPIVLKISAEKDAAVNTSLKSLQDDASKVQSAFSKVAGESEALLQSLAKLRQEAEKSGQGFSKGGKESTAALSETAKAAKEAAEAVRKSEEAKAVARQKARKNLEYALREEEKYRVASVAASKASADASKKSADEQAAALAKVRSEMDKNTQMSKELGTALAVGISVAGTALLGLAGYAVKVANEFEQMEAQLVTATGSTVAATKAIANAQTFASKSPFDLKGVVKATVQIEVYGQRSQDILPRVGALAAGMGKSIEDTALVVGKALSGSLEGFESLRNEYGITTRELVKFGAEQNKAGGILVQTAGQADKARTALLKIIDLRFGDAVQRQAATLKGQLEKVKDEATAFAGEVGKGAGVVVKFGAAFVGGGFELLRKIPAPIKEAAGAVLILSGGMLAAGAAALTFGGGLAFLLPRLIAVGGSSGAMSLITARATVMAGQFNTLGLTAIPRVGTALAGMASFVGVIGGITAAWGLAMVAVNAYIDAQKELQAQLKEQSRLFQQRIQENKDLAKAFNNLAKAEALSKGLPVPEDIGTGDIAKNFGKIKEILDRAPAGKFFEEMKKIGFGAEEAKKALASVGDEIKQNGEDVKRLQAELATSKAVAEKYKDSKRKDPLGSLGGNLGGTRKPAEVQADLNAALQQKVLDQNRANNIKLVTELQDKHTVSVDALGKAQQRADDYLKYADKIKDIKSMNFAYGVMAQKISVAATKLKALNEPTDRGSLLEKLRTGGFDANNDLKEQVKSYLDDLDNLKGRSEELRVKNQEGDKKALVALQQNLTAAKAAREVSRKEELANLAEQYEIAKKLGKEGESELTQIQNAQAALRKEQRKEESDAAKTAAQEALNAAKALPVAAKSSERGTQEAVDAYDTAIKRVKAWLAANEALIAKFPELGRQGRSAIQSLELARAQAEVARTTENFSELKKVISNIQSEAVSTVEKLEAVARARSLLTTAKATGKITAEQATEEAGSLGRQEKDLNRTKAQEDIQYQQSKLQLAEKAAQQELAILETLADGSILSNQKILASREQLYQHQIRAVELERDATIAANGDKVRAEEDAAEKIRQIERQKTADLHKELQSRYQDEKSRLQGIIDENSPEQAKPALDFGVDTTEDDKRRARKQAEEDLAAVNRKELFRQLNPDAVARDAETDRQRALRNIDPSQLLKQGQAALNPQAKGEQKTVTTTNNTVNVYNESSKTRNVRTPEDAVREVQKAIVTNQFYDPNAGL